MANGRKQEAGSSGEAKHSYQDMIAAEPDMLQRCIMIAAGMMLGAGTAGNYSSPEDYKRKLEDAPIVKLMQQVAESPAESLEWIEDAGKRTPEQQQALETAARDVLSSMRALMPTNYVAAAQLLEDYAAAAEATGKGTPYKDYYQESDAAGEYTVGGYAGDRLNVPLAAILIFFATHDGLDPLSPASPEGFATADRNALIELFSDMDAFYRKHKSEFRTILDMEQAFITATYPNPAQAASTLGRLNDIAIKPTHLVMPTHKLIDSLKYATREMDTSEKLEIILDVSKHGAKKQVTSTCVLSYDSDKVKIRGKKQFTEFHRSVYNAVASLYAAGNSYITPAMIWRTMTGKTRKDTPSHEQEKAIVDAVNDMRMMLAQIDASEEIKMRHITLNGEEIIGGGYGGNLLNFEDVLLTTATGKTWGYFIVRPPILYRYSADMNQLSTVPLGMLDVKTVDAQGTPTGQSAQYTERRSTINSYLLRRIQGMRGRNRLASHCIAYTDYEKDGRTHDGIYTIAGHQELSKPLPASATDADKTQRKNTMRYIRADVKLALDYWVATGYIAGYHEYKKGGTIAGVEIDLPQRKTKH